MQTFLKTLLFVMTIFFTLEVKGDLTSEVRAIFTEKCVNCHGKSDTAETGFDISDMKSLVEETVEGWVVPRNPLESRLIQAVLREEEAMPQGGSLTQKERSTLVEWVLDGAPTVEYKPPPVRSWEYWFEKAQSHLDGQSEEVAKDTRFLVLPETLADSELGQIPDLVHYIFSYLAHQSSKGKWLPKAVEGEPRMVAVRLSTYGLESLDWKIFEFVSEFTPVEGGWRHVSRKTDTDSPVLFLTEFGSRAFYHPVYPVVKRQAPIWSEFLRENDADPYLSQERGEVTSWTTLSSGVSNFPRILDRYRNKDNSITIWQSYDFARATEEANPIANPITSRSFQDGGEMVIFRRDRLPEFFLTDGIGGTIDRGPISVVSDPRQPDLHVALGKSCAACHAGGTVPVEDHLRPVVERFSWAYSWYEKDIVLRQHRPDDEASKIIEKDSHDFLSLMDKLGVNPTSAQLLQRLVVEQAGHCTMEGLSRILGVQPSAIESALHGDRELARNLGTLVTGPGIDWAVVEDQYPRLAWALRLEVPEKRNPMMERGHEFQERKDRRIAELSDEAVGLLDEQIGRSFQWASMLDPDDAAAFAAANEHEPAAVEARSRRILREDPYDRTARYILAAALRAQGRHEEAAEQQEIARRRKKRQVQ